MQHYQFREWLTHGNPERPWKLYSLPNVQGTVFPCHWHPEWELLVVERGVLALTRNQTVVTLVPGEAVLLTATELHGGTSESSDLLLHAFVFHPGVLRSEHRDLGTELWLDPLGKGTLAVPEVLGAEGRAGALARELVQVARENRPGVELAVKGILFQVLGELVSSGYVQTASLPISSDPRGQIRRILQIIEERFSQPLTVPSLAAEIGMSPSHFTRMFKAVTGEAPIHFLIDRRIAEATILLQDPEISVTEAAIRVGFTNFSHFTRTFRARQGVNPSWIGQNRRRGDADPGSFFYGN